MEELVVYTQYSKEETKKFERLYHKYKYIMQYEAYNVLFDRDEAEDAVQQAFLKVSKCLDKIDENNPAMTCSFLKVVARNVAIDISRKNSHVSTEDDDTKLMDDARYRRRIGVQQLVITKDNAERILKAIMELPEIYRDILLLEKVYGFKREDSMRILNASEETLKKRLTRAKHRLLKALEEEGFNDED